MRAAWLWLAAGAQVLAPACGAGAALASVVAATPRPAIDSTVRGLEAQHQAALIRERRLADERESRLIADYEGRLLSARRAYDRAATGSRGEAERARSELETARANFAQLVAQIARRDAETRAAVAAYAAEVRQLAAQASPERLAALDRFADGDRIGAWPVLEALRVAEDWAIASAANARRAVRWREDAALREIMRQNGEATTRDVLQLWEMAASLDTEDPWTQISLARLYREELRYEDANRATARLRALVAPEQGEISELRMEELARAGLLTTVYALLREEQELAEYRNDWPGALNLNNQRLQMSGYLYRLIMAAGPRPTDESLVARQVARDRYSRSAVNSRLQQLPEALADAEESVRIRQRVADIDPEADRIVELAVGRAQLSGAYLDVGRHREAAESAVSAFNALAEITRDNPSNMAAMRNKAGAALMALLVMISSPEGARVHMVNALMTEGTEAARTTFRADPSRRNRQILLDLLNLSGRLRISFGRISEALPSFRLLREVTRSAPADDPERISLQRLTASAEYYLSKHANGEGDWREAIRLFGLVQQSGSLTDDEQAMLAEARAAAAAAAPAR